MKLNSKKGFSLVELIIVIAIMGIIAAIGVPAFQGILRRTQVSADIRTGEGIAEAVAVLYSEDRGDVKSKLEAANISSPAAPDTDTKVWYNASNASATTLGVNFKDYYKESAEAKSESEGGLIFTVINRTSVVAIHGKPGTSETFALKKGDILDKPYDGQAVDDAKIAIVAVDGHSATEADITALKADYFKK